jgi:1-deoxy-D-xylulose-5-phosphate reductoisomerase
MGGMMKRLAILGSTGSIGQQTLEVVRAFPDRFQVVGLAAGRNIDSLATQIRQFHPRLVSFADEETLVSPSLAKAILALVAGCHRVPMEEMASHAEVDLVLVATSGKAGLSPSLSALKAGKSIALANKEVLVMAGEMITAEATQHGREVLPLDSEHSAIWQCLRGEAGDKEVARLLLTASGGPFLRRSGQQLATVTAEEALEHPTWHMGRKVTIDSATLMNKGMEVIEAHWLFGIPLDNIEVIIHPQSVVHSMVEFVDGSIKAQLGIPDMRLAIQYALSYPQRWPNPQLARLDWTRVISLSFEPVDIDRFPCLRLAIEAAGKGGTYPVVLSAADEVAVDLFLSGDIGFLDIARVVAGSLERHQGTAHPSLEEITAADAWARQVALEIGRMG